MIQSMTGFGRGESSNEDYKITVELKSVNHRYCDISVRLPKKLNYFEVSIRNQIKQFASRGKIDVYVTLEDTKGKNSGVKYNKETAGAYLEGIRQLSRDFLLEENVDAYMISRFPEVFTMEETAIDEDVLNELISQALQQAVQQLVQTRSLEGQKLCEDVSRKLDAIYIILEKIEKRGPELMTEYREKLMKKVNELLDNRPLDESTLATELIIYADKICVDEEIIRLKTHILHMKETLKEEDNIGRKLDFLIQEMNREANTILSKANDSDVSEYGIQLKTDIEKIREQIQNIE